MSGPSGAPTPQEIAEIAEDLGKRLVEVINDLVFIARGRPFSIAITKLEEALFWLSKGVQQLPRDGGPNRDMPP